MTTGIFLESDIAQMWSMLPHIDGTVIRWMAKKEGQVRGDFVETEEDLVKAAKSFWGWDFYVAPNATTKLQGTRHSARDVPYWSWFFVDIDPMGKTEQNSDNAAIVSGLARGLLHGYMRHDLVPCVIYSGRGMQLWCRLYDFELLSDFKKQMVQNAMRWWLHKLATILDGKFNCTIDTTCSDLPRVMRCPGTINSKTGRTAKWLKTGIFNPESATDLFLGLVPEEELLVATQPSNASLVGKPWTVIVPHLTWKAKEFITYGWQEPGRHQAAWHTAKKMFEAGASREEVEKALRWGNTMCRDGAGNISPLSDKDLQHAIDTAGRSGYHGKEARAETRNFSVDPQTAPETEGTG